MWIPGTSPLHEGGINTNDYVNVDSGPIRQESLIVCFAFSNFDGFERDRNFFLFFASYSGRRTLPKEVVSIPGLYNPLWGDTGPARAGRPLHIRWDQHKELHQIGRQCGSRVQAPYMKVESTMWIPGPSDQLHLWLFLLHFRISTASKIDDFESPQRYNIICFVYGSKDLQI